MLFLRSFKTTSHSADHLTRIFRSSRTAFCESFDMRPPFTGVVARCPSLHRHGLLYADSVFNAPANRQVGAKPLISRLRNCCAEEGQAPFNAV
jgi:hypothetical protein